MDDVKLSIDAYTLDTAAGKRRVESIEQDGSLVYNEPKLPGDDLSEQLARIWHEVPDGILDLYDAELALRPDDESVVKPSKEDDVEDDAREPGQALTLDEMEKMRVQVRDELNVARNELWFVLQLCKTLSVSSDYTSDPPSQAPSIPGQTPKKAKKNGPTQGTASNPAAAPIATPDDIVLPPGTFSATPSNLPLAADLALDDAYALELALASKQQALEECGSIIDAAVDELHSMSAAGDLFWSGLRELRDGWKGRGQWAIVPRPDFGRVMAEGESARDVIVPYALDEAPPQLRARSLAAFDLDPEAKEAVTFGARTYLRLKVTWDGASAVGQAAGTGIRHVMQEAQNEAFDEELFNELRIEAVALGGIVDGRRIDIAGLVFELVDSRHITDPIPSSNCELILPVAKLQLLRLHRARKLLLVSPSAPALAAGTILSSILQCRQYWTDAEEVQACLDSLCAALERAGIPTEVRKTWTASLVPPEQIGRALGDADGDVARYLGGTMGLDIDGCRGIQLDLSPKRALSVTTSRATVTCEVSDLERILTDDLALQLLSWAEATLRAQTNETVFLDELDESVCVGSAGCIRFSLVVAPSGSAVQAVYEPFKPGDGDDAYDARDGTLRDWLAGVARGI